MRSFQQIVFVLFALLVCVFAQDAYDTTVYVTSTVYRVNTVTLTGSQTGSMANQTSTISASYATYPAGNITASHKPTGSATTPSPSQFTGAAASLSGNAFVAALAAGAAYLVL